MKRFLLLLLSLFLLFVAACSGGAPQKTEPASSEEETLSAPADRYRAAVSATERWNSATYQTTVTGLSAPLQVKTLRVRKGYEGYALSRICGEETLIYTDGVAYLSSSLGKFRAETSTRLFNAYLEEKTFPIGCFSADSFGEITENGNTLVATQAADSLKARFELLEENWKVTDLKNTATLNEQGRLEKEVIEVEGVQNGATLRLTVTTSYSEDKGEFVTVKAPEDADSYLSVADVRIPDTVQKALTGLHSSAQLQMTAVTYQKLTLGSDSYVSSRETTLYQKGSGASFHHYHTVQELLQTPETEDFTLLQILVENGLGKETFYELTQAYLLDSKEYPAATVSSEELMAGILPSLSDLSSLTLSQGVEQDTISFSLSSAAQKAYAEKIVSFFEESGMNLKSYRSVTCSGTISVDRKTGDMISLAFRLEGQAEGEQGETGTVLGQYSINVDRRDQVEIPSLQIPTPTVPGQEPEGDHIC